MEAERNEQIKERMDKESAVLNSKIQELKVVNGLDTFQVGNFVDILDENKNWCVGQVIERQGDIVIVHYEGCPPKLDEKVSIKRQLKITHFRRNTRAYTGLKKTAWRNYVFSLDDVKEIEGYLKSFSETQFHPMMDAVEITQTLRGKIFTMIDTFMTTPYSSKEQITAIPAIMNLIFQFINFSVEFFKMYKENLFFVNNFLIKHKDLYLIHNKCAILAGLYDIITTLKRILGEDPRVSEFYKINDDVIKKNFKSTGFNTKSKICIEKAYKQSSEYNKLPATTIASLLDYFYDQGGFQSLWNIILSNDKFSEGLPFEILDVVLGFLQLFKVIIEFKNVFPNELNMIKIYFNNKLNYLTENEIKELKKNIFINTLKNYTVILPLDNKSQKVIFEDLYLQYHYKCLTSKNLEKRINGISAINTIIETIERRESYGGYSSNPLGRVEVDENIEIFDSKALLNFFKEKNFIEILLGENIHEEIIKRALPFFKLLARKSQVQQNNGIFGSNSSNNGSSNTPYYLNESVYDLLWSNYLEKHESIAIQIENIICELAFFISEVDKLYLFNKIKNYLQEMTGGSNNKSSNVISNLSSSSTNTNPKIINFSSIISTKMINFIKNFTENCYKKSSMTYKDFNSVDFFNDDKLFGLPLLWTYMQDKTYKNYLSNLNLNIMLTDAQNDSNFSQTLEVIELCVTSISELMNIQSVDEAVREKIISMCLQNFSCNTSIIQSLNLMKKMICEFPNVKSKKTVMKMNEMFNLINLILNDFQRYMAKVKESCFEYSKSHGEVPHNPLNMIFEGFYTHKQNLENRIGTIYFFANANKERGRIALTTEHIEMLWNLLVVNSNYENERNLFIEELRKNCEELDEVNLEYIFQNLITNPEKMNFSEMNMTSCILFEKFFNLTNFNKNKLFWDGRVYRVGSEDLIGINAIFKMLTEVRANNVRNKLAGQLVRLCCEIKIFNEDFCNKYWTTFMEKIFSSFFESCISNNENGIKGVLTFIKFLFRDIGAPGEIPVNDDVTFIREGLDYNFIYPEKNESRNIKIGVQELCCDVRTKIAYFFDIPVNMLKLKRQGKILDMSEDFKIFREFFSAGTPIEVIQAIHPILGIKNNPKTLILNNLNLVKTLHQLLHNSHSIYIQDVWELINILPKNAEIESEIASLGEKIYDEIDLKKYFDDESIYVMSYSLKIVKILIFKKELKEGSINGYEKSNQSSLPCSTDTCFNLEWITIFSKNKGVDYLVQLIFQFKIEYFDFELGFECLNDLIFLLKSMGIDLCNNKIDSITITKKIIDLVKIIIESSILKDKDPKMVEVQEKYRRKKERDLFKSYNDDENSSNPLIHENDDFCDELIKNWIRENECIRNLVSFLKLQNEDDIKNIFTVLLSEKEIFKYIVTSALIIPQNFKFKNSIHEFLDTLLSSDEENKNLFKSRVFKYMLSKETLKLANEHKETSRAFFQIVSSLMSKYINLIPNMKIDDSEEDSTQLDYFSLADFMVNYILNYDTEKEDCESILEGYMIILRVLILKSREITETLMKKYNLVDLILMKCLFSKCVQASSSAPFPKCKTSGSRQSAYKLLSAISYNQPETLKKIISILRDSHALGYWKTKKFLDWKISLQNDEKSPSDFVGLKNLGCTCYMNSLLQQFFMVPQLRESILASEDKHTGKIEESALFGLKNIFSSLKAYDSQYYNAKDFTQNFDGQQLDIREQMDVDEFFNTLIDKIENHIKDSPYQNLFKHFFGFTVSDEFICKGCPHYSERNVYSQSIQLQVLNKKSIVESLKSYVEGELLEGDNAYHCDKCDKKVNALKRQCIKTLPRVLIVVLKRFEFDYETMAKIKVNDYCEFPQELNMEAYTQEYLSKKEAKENQEPDKNLILEEEINKQNQKPDNYYKYNLSGVIIHTGTSESGHYYSIIKDTNKNNDKSQWYEFNDTQVKEYDISDLPNEAFGGSEAIFSRDNKKENIEKQTNAYLLFYTREFEYDEDTYIKNTSNCEGAQEKQATSYNSLVVKKWDKFSNISPTIMDRINLDNFQYWIMKIIFSSEYHSFITDLLVNWNTYDQIIKNYSTRNDNPELSREISNRLVMVHNKNDSVNNSNKHTNNNKLVFSNICSDLLLETSLTSNSSDFLFIVKKEDESELFQFACSFFFNVLIRSKEKSALPAMLDILKSFINKESDHAEWLLEEFGNFEVINDYLVECPLLEIRKLIVGVLYASMIKSYKSNSSCTSKSLNKLVNNLICFIIKNYDNPEKDMTFIFMMLYRYSLLGEESKLNLIKIGMLHYLTTKYLNNLDKANMELLSKNYIKAEFSQPSHSDLSIKMMNKVERLTAFEELLEKKHAEKLLMSKNDNFALMLFSELVCSCSGLNPHNSKGKILYPINEDIYLSKNLNFSNYDLVRLLILEARSKQAAIAVSQIFSLICSNNLEQSNIINAVILDLIQVMDSYELEYVLRIFKRYLLRTDDSIKDLRVRT
jgi:ubiquitin carboxyl-terminal hydrolase 9/24